MSENNSSARPKAESSLCPQDCPCHTAILAFNQACKEKDIGKEALEDLSEKITFARAKSPFHYVLFLKIYFVQV